MRFFAVSLNFLWQSRSASMLSLHVPKLLNPQLEFDGRKVTMSRLPSKTPWLEKIFAPPTLRAHDNIAWPSVSLTSCAWWLDSNSSSRHCFQFRYKEGCLRSHFLPCLAASVLRLHSGCECSFTMLFANLSMSFVALISLSFISSAHAKSYNLAWELQGDGMLLC